MPWATTIFFNLFLIRRYRISRTVQVFGLTTWFACPEWFRAYWSPKKSLTDMIASEKTEEKAAPVEKSAPKEPAKPAETPKVAPTAPATKTAQTTVSRKVEDLRAEAEALIKEQQALKDAKNKTTSKEDNLLNMAKQVQLNRQ